MNQDNEVPDVVTLTLDTLIDGPDWSKIRADFRGAVLLAQASGEAHARLVRFVEALPKVPAWMASLMKDKGQGE